MIWLLEDLKAKGHREEEVSLELLAIVGRRDEGTFHRFLAALKASTQEDLAGVH